MQSIAETNLDLVNVRSHHALSTYLLRVLLGVLYTAVLSTPYLTIHDDFFRRETYGDAGRRGERTSINKNVVNDEHSVSECTSFYMNRRSLMVLGPDHGELALS